jgi:hypothetical protein
VGSKIAGALRWYYAFEFEPDKAHLIWKKYLAINLGFAIEKNQLLSRIKTGMPTISSRWMPSPIKFREMVEKLNGISWRILNPSTPFLQPPLFLDQ